LKEELRKKSLAGMAKRGEQTEQKTDKNKDADDDDDDADDDSDQTGSRFKL